MRLVCVIPARLGSARLPNKPLRLLAGEPLIRVVAQRVLDMNLGAPVVVASDDQRVLDAVSALPVDAVLTGAHHRCGTERAAEVMSMVRYARTDVVVNVQGDQPFLPADAVAGALARVMAGDNVGTAARPLGWGALPDRNRVKVEIEPREGRAVAFYRSPPPRPTHGAVFEHLGVYAYTADSLARWVELPEDPIASSERLEQLRPFHQGWRFGVAVTEAATGHSIDTEEDLRLAEATL